MIKIRPAILLALATSVKGGTTSEREDLGTETGPDGAVVEKWETTKTTLDPDEHERAKALRVSIRAAFQRLARWTPFGLMVELEREQELREVAAEAERQVAEFNAASRHSKVRLSWLPARVDEGATATDAVRAIRQEVDHLLEDLQQATRAGDVEAIRDTANRAMSLGKLLAEDSPGSGELASAITEARRVARGIIRRVVKAGESAEDVIAEANLGVINRARFAFQGEIGPPEEQEQAPEGAEEAE